MRGACRRGGGKGQLIVGIEAFGDGCGGLELCDGIRERGQLAGIGRHAALTERDEVIRGGAAHVRSLRMLLPSPVVPISNSAACVSR